MKERDPEKELAYLFPSTFINITEIHFNLSLKITATKTARVFKYVLGAIPCKRWVLNPVSDDRKCNRRKGYIFPFFKRIPALPRT